MASKQPVKDTMAQSGRRRRTKKPLTVIARAGTAAAKKKIERKEFLQFKFNTLTRRVSSAAFLLMMGLKNHITTPRLISEEVLIDCFR